VAPLAPERFKLQLTISRKTRELLDEARDLLAHQVPDGDLAEVVDRALDTLVRELRRRKYAETEAPRKPRPVEESDHTRHIPNHVRREVARRDGHQCTFVAENGRRCPARGRLEFHHIDPHAQGGPPTLSNVTLRCRVHNGYAAEADYGAELMARRIAEARQGRQGRGARELAPGTVQAVGLFDAPESRA
jgi:5-methylcytosine-specific restriction endonuclease McrA